MTRYDLFWFLLVTVLMIAAGVREIRIGNAKTATALIAIPVCAWIAMLFGR